MSNGHIILINGESSSGKSTLARALQNSIALPFWHISIDHLRDHGVLPSARIKTGEFDWRSMRDAFFVGFERSLLAYVSAGNNLIVEHIMESEAWARRLADTLQGQDVFFVGVRCDLVELERRERARGDRRILAPAFGEGSQGTAARPARQPHACGLRTAAGPAGAVQGLLSLQPPGVGRPVRARRGPTPGRRRESAWTGARAPASARVRGVPCTCRRAT